MASVNNLRSTLSIMAAPTFWSIAMNIPSGNLRQGSSGQLVKDLQRELAAAGFSPGAADGIFGPHTASAVKAYQRAHHLAVDGIVGRVTRRRDERGAAAG